MKEEVSIGEFASQSSYLTRIFISLVVFVIVGDLVFDGGYFGSNIYNPVFILFSSIMTLFTLFFLLRRKRVFPIDKVSSFQSLNKRHSKIGVPISLKVFSKNGETKVLSLIDYGFIFYLKALQDGGALDEQPQATEKNLINANIVRFFENCVMLFFILSFLPILVGHTASEYFLLGPYYITVYKALQLTGALCYASLLIVLTPSLLVIFSVEDKWSKFLRASSNARQLITIFGLSLLLAPVFYFNFPGLSESTVSSFIHKSNALEFVNKNNTASMLLDKRYSCVSCKFSLKKGDSIISDQKNYLILATNQLEFEKLNKNTRKPSSEAKIESGQILVKDSAENLFSIDINNVKGKILIIKKHR